MHEFSIVNALMDMCEKNAKENNATKITKVEIKIGKLSGVEPHLLKISFDTFKEKTICDGAELVMNIQDLIIECRTCKAQSVLQKNIFICPLCKSTEVTVLDGEEMLLMSLEME